MCITRFISYNHIRSRYCILYHKRVNMHCNQYVTRSGRAEPYTILFRQCAQRRIYNSQMCQQWRMRRVVARECFKKTSELSNLRAPRFHSNMKCTSFNVWVRYFVWIFKRYLWNSTQNILPIHCKLRFLYNVENVFLRFSPGTTWGSLTHLHSMPWDWAFWMTLSG